MIDLIFQKALKIILIIIFALIIFALISYFDKKLVNFINRKQKKAAHLDERLRGLKKIINTASGLIIFIVVIIMILKELNVDTGPILASAGIVGLAGSLAAQTFLKDAVTGLMIISESQYHEGDYVKLDDVKGKVEKIYLRKTIIKDDEGNLSHIPHGQVKVVTILDKKR